MLKIVEKKSKQLKFVKYSYVLYQALSRRCHLTNKRSIYSDNCIFSILNAQFMFHHDFFRRLDEALMLWTCAAKKSKAI